jgi:hypothetical protein
VVRELLDDVGGIGGACIGGAGIGGAGIGGAGIGGAGIGGAGIGGAGIGGAGIGGADVGLEYGDIVGIVLFLRFEELLNVFTNLEKILLPEDLNI